MTHLTLTGRYAGQTYCGKTRSDALADGEGLSHLPYGMTESFKESICPECMKVLTSDED